MKQPYTLDSKALSLNWLLYADPGNSKTSFSSTMALHPAMSPVLHLNVDGGVLTIADMQLPQDTVQVVDIDVTKDMEELFWAIKNPDGQFADVKSVVIDNATEATGMALEEIVGQNINKTSGKGERRSSLDDAWLEDRGAAGNRMARLFRWYRDIPQHLVCTAHVRREFPRKGVMPDTTKPPIRVEPDFPPALSRRVRGYMDFCWYLLRELEDTVVLTQPRGAYYAKTRGTRLCKAFGEGFRWPEGFALMPALYETIINDKPFPLEILGSGKDKE